MPLPTPELGLQKAEDSDDTADYLTVDLGPSLVTLDSLFNNVTGHTHGGVHQGGPIGSIPATAIPDGSITSAKIADGSIATVDLQDGLITAAKLAPASVTTVALAAGLTLTTPTLNNPTVAGATDSNSTFNSPTINGTISGTPTWSSGPYTNDWVRVNPINQGIFNVAAGVGVAFDTGGAYAYGTPGGGHYITETAAQVLSNKTLTSPTINNATINSPTLAGTVAGTPTWASPQTFPSSTKIGSSATSVTGTHSSTDWIIDCGTIFFNAVPNGGQQQTATNFNGAYSAAPKVVCQIRDSSGGQSSVQGIGVEANGVGTNGFFVVIDNRSGGSQSVSVDWLAMGH